MNQLKVIERKDQRVLTSAQLAEAFGTDLGKIRYNFNYNKERYEEGEHYFVLKGQDVKNFKTECEIHTQLKHAHTIYLWTEKGVFMHAKSLSTDQAWNAYRDLLDDYFKKTDQLQRMNVPSPIPTTIEGILELAVLNMKDMRSQIDSVREENDRLKLIVDNSIYLDDHQKAKVQEAVKSRVGHLMKKGYEAHFQSIFSGLKVFFTVPKYDKILRKDFDEAIEYVNSWYPKKAEETQ